jgi:hypothetical protein
MQCQRVGRMKRELSRRRGDASKIILGVIGICLFSGFVVCCGGGVAAYFWFQKAFGRAGLTNPTDIDALRREMVDMELPPQFQPNYGSDVFGFRMVHYRWQPAGAPALGSPPAFEEVNPSLSSLSLISFGAGTGVPGVPPAGQPGGPAAAPPGGPAGGQTNHRIPEISDEELQEAYISSEIAKWTHTVRGEVCEFRYIEGELRAEPAPTSLDANPAAAPTDPTQPLGQQSAGPVLAGPASPEQASSEQTPAGQAGLGQTSAEQTPVGSTGVGDAPPSQTDAPAGNATIAEAPADALQPEAANAAVEGQAATNPADMPIDETTVGEKPRSAGFHRSVSGTFPGKNGETILLQITVPRDSCDREVLEQLIRSIK